MVEVWWRTGPTKLPLSRGSRRLSPLTAIMTSEIRHNRVVYAGAGHPIAAPPYAPTTATVLPGPGVMFDHGGDAAATARARADVRRRTLEFLAAV
jgi:hypothetical protein